MEELSKGKPKLKLKILQLLLLTKNGRLFVITFSFYSSLYPQKSWDQIKKLQNLIKLIIDNILVVIQSLF